MSSYTLPDSPYDYSALEPYISGQIMELHHDKHHKAYVDGTNATLDRLAEARARDDFGAIVGLEKSLAFNLSGHVLLSIYWQHLVPGGGGKPEGELAEAIEAESEPFDAFRSQLTQAASTAQGSGWGSLSWDSLGSRLLTTQIYDHQWNSVQGTVPLLVIDIWEHAYYL
jgi:superoxide dismutase, Fe-Mn family